MVLSSSQWQIYRNIINKAHDSFNKEIVTWHRHKRSFQRYGEDTPANITYEDIPLESLISYNAFRIWPLSKETSAGVVDKESAVIILNKKYLEGLGYLNSDGFFDMDPGRDEFSIRGMKYRASGEIEVSQAYDEPLLFYVIISRKQVKTGTDKY